MADKKKVEKKEKKKPFYMAPGKAITCLKKILGPGEEVKFEFFKGGEDTVEKFVDSEHIIDTERYFEKKKAEAEKKKGK